MIARVDDDFPDRLVQMVSAKCLKRAGILAPL